MNDSIIRYYSCKRGLVYVLICFNITDSLLKNDLGTFRNTPRKQRWLNFRTGIYYILR